jgi:hypothetical protein
MASVASQALLKREDFVTAGRANGGELVSDDRLPTVS